MRAAHVQRSPRRQQQQRRKAPTTLLLLLLAAAYLGAVPHADARQRGQRPKQPASFLSHLWRAAHESTASQAPAGTSVWGALRAPVVEQFAETLGTSERGDPGPRTSSGRVGSGHEHVLLSETSTGSTTFGVHGAVASCSNATCSRLSAAELVFTSDHDWFTDPDTRQRALALQGDVSRVRAAAARYLAGGNLTVVFLGGSITCGHGLEKEGGRKGQKHRKPDFVQWTQQILRAVLATSGIDPTISASTDTASSIYRPGREGSSGSDLAVGRIHLLNQCVSGTTSAYMSLCHRRFLPPDTDLVFAEYAANDPESLAKDRHMDNVHRRYLEQLLRQLLNYNRRPAVVLLNAFVWQRPVPQGVRPGHVDFPGPGEYWRGVERDLYELASYYELPMLSMRSCCYHHMRTGQPGFRVDLTINSARKLIATGNATIMPTETLPELERLLYYKDGLHPSPIGYQIMGEMVSQYILDTLDAAQLSPPPAPADSTAVEADLPPPMLEGNWEPSSNRCLVGTSFRDCVKTHDPGWSYVDEARPGQVGKWGYVSNVTDSKLTFQVDTTAIARVGRYKPAMVLTLSYLRSYEGMGQADVRCLSGCKCEPTRLDGHIQLRHSELYMMDVVVSESHACVVQVKVLDRTSSGGFKVKLAGAIVKEENAGVISSSAELAQPLLLGAMTAAAQDVRAGVKEPDLVP